MMQLPYARMLVLTVCIVVILIAVGLFLKVCKSELDQIGRVFQDLCTAALKELSFQGDAAGKSNIILCLILAAVFILLCVPTIVSEIITLFLGTPERGTAKYILFLCLLGFFGWSLCFISSRDEYSEKMTGQVSKRPTTVLSDDTHATRRAA